jgi:phage baseplate assembly protein W
MILPKEIYSDIPVFLTQNPFTSDISIKKDQNAIQEAFRNIVLTRLGERAFDYTFGTNLYNFIFEHPVIIKFYLDGDIRTSISRFEPRVTIQNIEYEIEEQELTILLTFTINEINTTQTLTITIERTR